MSAKRTAKKLKRLKPNEAFPIIRIAGFEITFADLLTALNLVAGVAAIFSAFKGETLISLILIVGGIFSTTSMERLHAPTRWPMILGGSSTPLQISSLLVSHLACFCWHSSQAVISSLRQQRSMVLLLLSA
jgi:hypothetical protein